MESYHTMDSLSSRTTPDTPVGKARTRASLWVPRRVFYVLRHLQRTLTPGKAQAISNKQIQTAIKFGSEGEVSQIMRWLSGERPTMGRWAYGALNTNTQTYRFIARDRLPSGGYSVTLLATPERIDVPAVQLPQIVQLSFFGEQNDPPMIPHAGQQDAAQGGSFSHDPLEIANAQHSSAPNARSQGDQHEETHEESDQKEELARTLLFDWLMTQPGMSRSLATKIAAHPIGSLAEFEVDLRIAQTFARSPLYFTCARWRDGQRVEAPEEGPHAQPQDHRTSRNGTSRRRGERPGTRGRSAPSGVVDAAAYAAILAAAIPLDIDIDADL